MISGQLISILLASSLTVGLITCTTALISEHATEEVLIAKLEEFCSIV